MITAYFERKSSLQGNLYMYHYEKVLKHSDIVWFVSSACNLRRPWPECVGRVNRTFCFTGASVDVEGAVVRRPISA